MQLTLEGYIESRQNVGFYVLKMPKAFQSERTLTEPILKTEAKSDDDHIV